jgi:hypothetical protein
MPHSRVVTIVGLLALSGSSPALAQVPALGAPRTGVQASVGVRDGGDLGSGLTFFTVGVRRQQSSTIALTLGVVRTPTRGGDRCPAAPDVRCFRGSVTAAEAGAEFIYGDFRLQPYGVVSVGVAQLRGREENIRRTGPSYSTGLGLNTWIAPRVALFGEGRYRQETFGSINARGYGALLGVRVGW